jgi:hypothetical protein
MMKICFDKLLKYLPKFRDLDLDEMNRLEKEENDLFDGPPLPKWFEEFLQECRVQGVMQGFDYQEWYKNHEDEIKNHEDDFIKNADIDTLSKLITMHTRVDRFVGGHLFAQLKSRHFYKILCRLQELTQSNTENKQRGIFD